MRLYQIPPQPVLLGKLEVVGDLYSEVAALARMASTGRVQDTDAIRAKTMVAYDILAKLASQVSHCDLENELQSALMEAASLSKMAADGTADLEEVHQQALALIKITIKIWKITITIEF